MAKKKTLKEEPIPEESIPLPEKAEEKEISVPTFNSVHELRVWSANLAPGEHDKVREKLREQKKKLPK